MQRASQEPTNVPMKEPELGTCQPRAPVTQDFTIFPQHLCPNPDVEESQQKSKVRKSDHTPVSLVHDLEPGDRPVEGEEGY